MKKLALVALTTILFCFDVEAFVRVDSAYLVTQSPTNCDTTKLYVSGSLGAANYTYTGSTVSISGSVITVNVNYTSGGIILPAITPFNHTISLGLISPSGNYTITVNGVLNSTTSSTKTVPQFTVSACCALTAGFKADFATYCANDTVRLTDTSSASATSFKWYVNGNFLDSTQNLVYVLPSSGNYLFKLIVDDTCGTDSISHLVRALAPPDLGPDTVICTGQSYTLSVDTLWATYAWSNGKSTNSVTLTSGGTYRVTVQANSGCVKTDTVQLSLVGQPLNLGPDTAFCPGDTILLDAGSGWSSVLWSTGNNGRYLPVFFTTVLNCLAIDSNACAYQDTISISRSNLTLSVQGPDSICDTDTARFSIGGGWSSISWSTGDTSTSIELTSSGNYSVSAISADLCFFSVAFDLAVVQSPIVSINDTNICQGEVINYNVTNPNSTYLWDDGSFSPARAISSSGSYWIQITRDNICTVTDSFTVHTHAIPNVSLGSDTTICAGDTLTIAAGSADAYLWSNGGTTGTTQIFNSGVYWVQATNGATCSSSDTIRITVEDCAPEGIYELPRGGVSIYPNPAGSLVSLSFGSPLPSGIIRIINLQGQKVDELEIREMSSEVLLQVDALTPGVYILSLDEIPIGAFLKR